MLNQYLKKILLISLFFIQFFSIGLCLIVSDILILAFIETGMLTIQLLYMYEITKNIANFPNVFLLISYIFNIPTIFLGEIFEYTDLLYYRYFEVAEVADALRYYIIITFFLWFGASTKRCYRKHYLARIVQNKYALNNIRTVGTIFMIIGFIPNLYIALEKFFVRKSGSYIDIYNIDYSGVGILSYFLYFGAVLCMYACRDKKSAIKIIIICIPCMLMKMLSGSRYDSVCMMVVFLYLYINQIEKIQWKKMGLYVAIVVTLMITINIMGTIRDTRYSADLIADRVADFSTKNPITGFFAEFGNTLRTLLLTIKYVPDSLEYANGMTYIKFWIMFVPHLNDYLKIDLIECSMALYLPDNAAIGGSWIAEIFYNFNYWGIFPAVILGRLLVKIDIGMRQKICKETIFYLNLLFPTIEFIREYFVVYRYGLYFTIASYIFLYIINKIYKYINAYDCI